MANLFLAVSTSRLPQHLPAILWHHLAASTFRAFLTGIVLFLLIFALERYYKIDTTQYRSRNVLHDLVYWFYSRSDLHRILFTAVLFAYLGAHLKFMEIRPFKALPAALRWVVYFLFAEFLTYWIHRLQHSNRFLWAFHSVHHSQERLTFLTAHRNHPIDNFVINTLSFVPLLLLGQPVKEWLPIYYLMEFLIALEHSQLPWHFGPLQRIFVSPAFHSIHHSVRPEHHNRNFGRLLSMWDCIFGTAVLDEPRPATYGLSDCKMPTLLSQLCSPCVRAYREVFQSTRFGGPQPVAPPIEQPDQQISHLSSE